MLVQRAKVKRIAALGMSLLLGASLLLTGCGGGGSKGTSGGGAKKDKALTIGMTTAPAELNPLETPDTAGRYVSRFMFDTLLGQPEPNKFTPHLANGIDTKDSQTYTVKLNPKAQWSDGKPITADDLVFTLNLAANPKVVSSLARYMNFMTGLNASGKLTSGTTIPNLKKLDDHTVEFKTKKPLDPNIVKGSLGFSIPLVPKHVYEKLDPKGLSNAQEVTHPKVFSGAYKLVKYVSNDHLEFEANDKYVLGTPKIKKLFITFSNDTNLVVALKAGKVQMNSGLSIGNVPIKDLDTLKKDSKLVVNMYPATSTQFLMPNNKVFDNVHFRRGLAYAVNRQQLRDQLLKGYAELTPTLYTTGSAAYDKTVTNYPFDTAKAKEEFKQSGMDLTKEITLMVTAGNSIREQTADLIQQNLNAAGLNVKVSKMDFPTLIGRVRKGDYQLALMSLAPPADPNYSMYFTPGSLSNYSHTDDEKLTAMFMEGIEQTDSAKRIAIYKEIQKYLKENVFQVALFNQQNDSIRSKNLVGGTKPFWEGSLDDLYKWELK